MILPTDGGGRLTSCPHCASELIRIQRTTLQRVFCREAFRCPGCDGRLQRLYPSLERPYRALQAVSPWLDAPIRFDGHDDHRHL
jgi:hypothetical protein